MTSAILPVAGAVGGFFIGGPVGALMGANLGMAANNAFMPGKKHNVRLPSREGLRLGDLRVQLSSYGEVIPKVYGSMRLAGNIIWATDIREVATEHVTSESSRGGGKGGGGRSTVTTTHSSITYSYFVSLAIAICEGEVSEVIRVWADSKLLTEELLRSNQGKFNIHLGTEEQLPDDIIGRYKRAGTYPAYRGLCYVVIDDLPLEQFGNRIPNFSFEVRRSVRFKPAVEDKIKEVVLIPGAGEFVYADKVHSKQDMMNALGSNHGTGGSLLPASDKSYLNMHNYTGKANILLALDQMAKTLPNLEWVAVVVTWFATSTKAGDCRIVPKIEYRSDNTQVSPRDWQVAGITRSQAEVVLYLDAYTPTYGGTPADETVTTICQHLRSRGYKVMFYPMIFVDEIQPKCKPWRGRITATSAKEIDEWFNNPYSGYNRFILHYVKLMRGAIDAFIIGSELVGLTSFTDSPGSYPAVNELIQLASKVKTGLGGLGNNTLVTYAADWSEYHHTSGGWFNLDPLWSSPSIDIVGIDAYFPLTEDLPQSQITPEAIEQGWESGEGWHYYWADGARQQKRYFATDSPNTPYKYAWKNLEYWWSNTHQNPDGRNTAWLPRMKPVWFTEFGFPSVDGCSNQPNVFYDPSSVESYFPRGSSGRVNFFAQRQALSSTLDYLTKRNTKSGCEQLVPRRFVWTYDARPFPFWPDFKHVWQDGNLWPTGHWINGKLGISSLGAIIAEILANVGLQPSDYDVSRLTDDVYGYIISEHITAREAIEQLQAAYFFDTAESDGILKFVKRLEQVQDNVVTIDETELVPEQGNGNGGQGNDIRQTLELTITQELELPQKVSVTHMDSQQNYDLVTVQSQRQAVKTLEQVSVSLPLVLASSSAKQIADITLYNAWQERINYKLTVPAKYAALEPTDIIRVNCSNQQNQTISYIMRIVKTDMQRSGLMKIIATSYSLSVYDFYNNSNNFNTNYLAANYEVPKPIAGTIITLVEAPPLPAEFAANNANQAMLYIAVVPDDSNWAGAAIYRSTDNGYDYRLLATSVLPSTIGVAVNKLGPGSSLLFDNHNKLVVQLVATNSNGGNGPTLSSVSELALLNGANAALLGDELIQFQNAELLSSQHGISKYLLSKLLRGRQGTEMAINSHRAGESFILLNTGLIPISMHHNLIGSKLLYKAVSIGSSLGQTLASIEHKFTGRNLKPFAPVYAKATKDSAGNIGISWIRRSRTDSNWRDHIEVPIGEESEQYHVEIKQGSNVIRILTSTTQGVTYSLEQQLADANIVNNTNANNTTTLANLTATIYQISSQVGRGYGTTIALA